MDKYSKTFNFPLDRMHLFYNNPKLPDKGAIAAVKMKKLNRCGIIINTESSFIGYTADFIEAAPSVQAGKWFAVAREMSNCQFSFDQSNQIMLNLGIASSDQSHGQEILADMMGTLYLIKSGVQYEAVIKWLEKERTGHFFSINYNTAKYIAESSLGKLKEILNGYAPKLESVNSAVPEQSE